MMDFPVLNKCPGYNLYIGGFIALRRPKALQNCHITHILSVLSWQFESDSPLTRGYQHLHIPVDDVEDENLLAWFPRSNAFIHDALTGLSQTPAPPHAETPTANPGGHDADPGNGVLIHCAMGKSRSATVLLAYLLWQSRQSSVASPKVGPNDPSTAWIPDLPFSVADALALLRQGRPIAEPNEGFMDQLHLYVAMGCPTTQAELENHRLYKRWMNQRNVEESLRINQAPDVVDIRFEDEDTPSHSEVVDGKEASISAKTASLSVASTAKEGKDNTSSSVSNPASSTSSKHTLPEVEIAIKCRRCRHLLARSAFTIPHIPYKSDPSAHTTSNEHDSSSAPCAHIFLHPLSWMRESLSGGQLEGRLTCPNKKCQQNIGKFAWQGLRCSCGKWITPAFALGRGRIDEAKILASVEQRTLQPDPGAGGLSVGGGVGGGAGVRFPPGMRGAGKGKI